MHTADGFITSWICVVILIVMLVSIFLPLFWAIWLIRQRSKQKNPTIAPN